MARFVLVHGACHGAWCWAEVAAALEAAGHEALAIDLPCRGEDAAPAAQATLDLFAARVVEALAAEPSILVAHSFGGFPATRAADLAPGRVAGIVYVCAYLPDGRALADLRRSWPERPLRGTYLVDPGRTAFSFRPDILADRFYHDCPPAALALARARLCPEPVAPQEEACAPGKSLALPRRYILCEEDRAIPPGHQAAMTAGWPEGSVVRIRSSHSPFLSMPGRLAELISAPFDVR